jgi:uncharacterized protein
MKGSMNEHPTLDEKLEALSSAIREKRSLLIGLSSGVDSALLAAIAFRELGNRAMAATAASPALSSRDRELASLNAAEIGIRHIFFETEELKKEEYAINDAMRCFHCRAELSERLLAIARDYGMETVAIGINASDFSDYRPGIAAALSHGVWLPLAEFKFSKQDVREAASRLKLSAHDRHSNACLSSRVQYGQRIDASLLSRVERGEELLCSEGFTNCRLRVHGPIARIEVEPSSFHLVLETERRERIVKGLKELGFIYITFDLEGLRSGSMNLMLRSSQ